MWHRTAVNITTGREAERRQTTQRILIHCLQGEPETQATPGLRARCDAKMMRRAVVDCTLRTLYLTGATAHTLALLDIEREDCGRLQLQTQQKKGKMELRIQERAELRRSGR